MTRPRLSLTFQHDGDCLVVRLSGEFDLATRATVPTAIADALTDQVRHIVIDAGSLTFCDPSGVSILVNLRRAAEAEGRRLSVTNPQPQVRRVLAHTGTLTDLATGPEH